MAEIVAAQSYAEQIAELNPMDALFCLEAMSRRLLQIDNGRPELPLIPDIPQEILGGQLASVRRTLIGGVLFYNEYGMIPFLPVEESALQKEINSLGKAILSGISPEENEKWKYAWDRHVMARQYR